jgi:hypothetical protein
MPMAGLFCGGKYPQPVGNFGRKTPAFRRPDRADFIPVCPVQILEALQNLTHIWGSQTEQLSDFSTVRAVYPQFLGSYPQFCGRVVYPGAPYVVSYRPALAVNLACMASIPSRKRSSPPAAHSKSLHPAQALHKPNSSPPAAAAGARRLPASR